MGPFTCHKISDALAACIGPHLQLYELYTAKHVHEGARVFRARWGMGTRCHAAARALHMGSLLHMGSADSTPTAANPCACHGGCLPAETPLALLGHKVSLEGLRPAFPPTAPAAYKELAAACWAQQAAPR